jgi:hypothetical protein
VTSFKLNRCLFHFSDIGPGGILGFRINGFLTREDTFIESAELREVLFIEVLPLDLAIFFFATILWDKSKQYAHRYRGISCEK